MAELVRAMFLSPDVLALFAGVIVSILASQLVERRIRRQHATEAERQRATEKEVAAAQHTLVATSLADIPEDRRQRFLDYLLHTQYENGSFPNTAIILEPKTNAPSIEQQVEQSVSPLRQRLQEIERRFPNTSTIDKISSVNDAILATRLDALDTAIKRVEEKALTKWDVTKLVFEVIGALGLLVGIVIAGMNYFLSIKAH